jgi:hypothetical protein
MWMDQSAEWTDGTMCPCSGRLLLVIVLQHWNVLLLLPWSLRVELEVAAYPCSTSFPCWPVASQMVVARPRVLPYQRERQMSMNSSWVLQQLYLLCATLSDLRFGIGHGMGDARYVVRGGRMEEMVSGRDTPQFDT